MTLRGEIGLAPHELDRPGPRDRQDQGADPLGVVQGEPLGDGPTHGGPEYGGPLDLEVVEEADGVVGHLLDIRDHGPRGAAHAPVIEGYEPVRLGAGPDLAGPVPLVKAEPHDAEYRRTMTTLLKMKLDVS